MKENMDNKTIKALDNTQFISILNLVNTRHSFGTSGKQIKYIDFSFDTRTQTIWSMKFRGMHEDFEIATNTFCNYTEEFIETAHDNMYDYIMEYLEC